MHARHHRSKGRKSREISKSSERGNEGGKAKAALRALYFPPILTSPRIRTWTEWRLVSKFSAEWGIPTTKLIFDGSYLLWIPQTFDANLGAPHLPNIMLPKFLTSKVFLIGVLAEGNCLKVLDSEILWLTEELPTIQARRRNISCDAKCANPLPSSRLHFRIGDSKIELSKNGILVLF